MRRPPLAWAVLSLGVLSCQRSCSSEVVTAEAPAGSASPAAARRAPPPAPTLSIEELCHQETPGFVDDERSPTARGAGPGVEPIAWFAAHGVSKNAYLDLLVMLQGDGAGGEGVDRGWAEGYMARLTVPTLRVGPGAEEGVWLEYDVQYELEVKHGAVVVVRAGRPQIVLDVGLGVGNIDDEHDRPLDLAVSFEPGGLAATLSDRAPEGTRHSPWTPSACVSFQREQAECRQLAASLSAQHAREQPPGSRCHLERRPGGSWHLSDTFGMLAADDSLTGDLGTPEPAGATMHGCTVGLDDLRTTVKEMSGPMYGATLKKVLRDAEKMCAQRGRWVWEGSRFVKEK